MQRISRSIIAAAACAAFLAGAAPAARADVSYYSPPKFKHKILPVYPDSARAAHETGKVLVKILVDASGQPKQFILFKSSGHKDLDAAVMTAVKSSTFSPAMRGTTPTVGFYDVTYVFNLTGVAQDEGNLADLSKKLANNPHDVSSRLALGTDYLNQKNYAMAEQTFQAGTQAAPNNAKMYAYLGLAYFQDAQSSNDPTKYQPAVDAYDKALSIDPKVVTSNVAAAAYFTYGFHLQQSGDTTTAMKYAQKAVTISPNESQFYILLGEVQTSQLDYAGAIASLKKAEALDAKLTGDKKSATVTSRIIADLGNAELAQGDTADGLADINRAERVAPHAQFAYQYLFSWYERNQKPQSALTPLNQLESLDPKNPLWPLQIGNIYLGLNNVVAAREAFQKAVAIDPKSTDAQFGMTEVAAVSGDLTTVGTTMNKITAAASPKQAAVYESSIAIWLINASSGGKSNFYSDAAKYADQATKADAANGQGWYSLGAAQAQLKQSDNAKSSLKKAYDIFKAQNNDEMVKRVSDMFKQIAGSDISSYSPGR